jgi:hypothetical protein
MICLHSPEMQHQTLAGANGKGSRSDKRTIVIEGERTAFGTVYFRFVSSVRKPFKVENLLGDFKTACPDKRRERTGWVSGSFAQVQHRRRNSYSLESQGKQKLLNSSNSQYACVIDVIDVMEESWRIWRIDEL